ncbi:dUTP diphosphatase [Clostridium oryzae]|uniref:dUTPase n=1 Tax=Clostridium oryzae TaxID=1450648 RepID=A0A1V4IQY2_9CLOT|nr:dUTP diphosphatase [Clostridium oryzae]OPJ62289.1 dUTPase [Clostridium oryzae]
MNLEKLLDLQKELDLRIVNQHKLQSVSLVQKKVLALQVEIGELANETRCFKYWSLKAPSPSKVILEEYVDCLHFILSIGLEKDFYQTEVEVKQSDSPLTDQFLNLYIDISDFFICPSADHYITLFEDFLSLGDSLGFDENTIENGYIEKNTKNHVRQSVGY